MRLRPQPTLARTAAIDTSGQYCVLLSFQVNQPVASGLIRVGSIGGGNGILAGVENVVIKELSRAAPEVEFPEIGVLLPGSTMA